MTQQLRAIVYATFVIPSDPVVDIMLLLCVEYLSCLCITLLIAFALMLRPLHLDIVRSNQGRGDVTHHEVPLGCLWCVMSPTVPIREWRDNSEVSVNLWRVNVTD